jgi:predicted O-methyltransferase YrrM
MRSILFGLATGLVAALLMGAATLLGATSWTAATPVIIGLAIGMSILHYWKTLHFQAMRDGHRQTNNRLSLLDDHISETQGLVQLSSYNHTYPMPFGGSWALTPDAAVVLAREIALNRPQTIVELGSGVSTVLIGRMLKQAGSGKLFSLDHDAGWAAETRRHIEASALQDHVVVLDAPLAKQPFGGQEFNWYQVPEQLKQAGSIDLIIVDGPPQALDPSGMPRYPALPAFLAQLSPKAMFYVDDAKRPQEQAMIARWLHEHPEFESRIFETVPGTCLLKRNG